MIFSYISGRLGNQLFEYAYIRSLIYKSGRLDNLCLNFNLVKNAGKKEDGFIDSLKDFRVLPYSETNLDIVACYGGVIQKVIYYE